MGTDYIPDADGAFLIWIDKFLAGITANMVALGLSQATVDAVAASVTKWKADRQARHDADAVAAAAVKAEGASHTALVALIRGATHTINGHPNIDNALRAKAALPAHDEVRTPIGAPTTKPIGRIEVTGHNTLTIHFVDETTPLRTAKPHGVHACEIWFFVGDPAPGDPSGYAFLLSDTRTPHVHVHQAADAGKTAHYLLRWLNTKNERGPWSDVYSAKIPS